MGPTGGLVGSKDAWHDLHRQEAIPRGDKAEAAVDFDAPQQDEAQHKDGHEGQAQPRVQPHQQVADAVLCVGEPAAHNTIKKGNRRDEGRGRRRRLQV